ncbi:MAG: glutamyl-tRNA reductase [Glaciecola sp.]|uniref:glutamyl-tRNA reductase n=2 Tax=Congregibacter sp. TaxID=2744308 RepID=UPI0039E428A4
MNLIALGINHNSANVDVRERVAFAPEQVSEAMNDVCRAADIDEVVVLSTCNRTEIYAVAPPNTSLDAKARELIDWMAAYHHLSVDDLRGAAYHHEGEAALRHMVHVAAGLDSMVLGEPQIFGQLKSAYAVASEAGTVGSELGRLFPRVFSIAKKVRTDTAIGENPVSVAYAAVDVARRIFTDLGDCNALLVGAGETIELVTRHLIEAGVSNIVIANRTLGRARELAQKFGAEAVLLAEIPDHLPTSDIVITSTASQLPIIGKGTVESALKVRRHRPMLMIDIAVPRDIEPQVRDLRDVYLYSVDDLGQIVDGNLRARQKEVSKADEIIALGIASVGEEQRSLGAVDLVKEYRQSAEALRQRELERALTSISRGEDPQKVLVQLARAITNKLIHAPTTGLKKASAEGRHDVLGHAARLLGLRVDDLDAQPNTARSPSGSPSGSPSDKTEQNTEASSSESAAISPMSPVTNAAQAKSAIESESPRTPGPTLQ